MALANEQYGSMQPDGLLYDSKFPMDTKTVTLAGGQGVLARGSVIAFPEDTPDVSGTLWKGETGKTAACILCDEVDTGSDAGQSIVAHAYRSGHFCRQMLILDQSVTELTNKAEKELQDAGIYLSNAMM